MSDDPTEWFRRRAENQTPDDGAGADADQPATQPLGAGDRPDPPDAGAGDDRLSTLFGDRPDDAAGSDRLPPGDDAGDAPTAVQPTAPRTDPLGWLGDRPADDATTVALGASGAGFGAAAGAPALDDALTQRFDEARASAPTGAAPTGGGLPPEDGRSRKLVIVLAIVGTLLAIAIVVALLLLFSGGSGPPTASPSPSGSASTSRSPSPTPIRTSAPPSPSSTPSPTPPPPPPVPAPTIGDFSTSPPNSAPACTATTGTVQMSFRWATSNAVKVSLSIDGVQDPYNDQLTGSGTLSGVPYDCSKASQGYTLLATNSKGQQASKPLTLVRPPIDGGGSGGGGSGGGGGGDSGGSGGGTGGSGGGTGG